MKRCSRCQSTYADFVEFCFEDGEVLVPDEPGGKPKVSATMDAMDPAEAPPLPPRPLARPPVPPVRRDFPVRGAEAGEAFEAPVAGSVPTASAATGPREDLTTEVEEVLPSPPSDLVDDEAEQGFWDEEPVPAQEMPRASRKGPYVWGLVGAGVLGCVCLVWALSGGEPPEASPVDPGAEQKAVALAEVPSQREAAPAAHGANPDAGEVEQETAAAPLEEEGEEERGSTEEAGPDVASDDDDPGQTPQAEAPVTVEEPVAVARPRPNPIAVPKPQPQPTGRPRPRPQPSVSVGSVTIESDPSGSTVFIDGEGKGETPLTLDLAYGDHLLELRRSGRTPYSGKINVSEPEATIPLVTLASSLFGQAPTEGPGLAAPAAPAEAMTWVNLTVVWVGHDGHKLHIDGQEQGNLPVSVRVSTGMHVFEVVAPDGTSSSERREIAADQGGVLTFGI